MPRQMISANIETMLSVRSAANISPTVAASAMVYRRLPERGARRHEQKQHEQNHAEAVGCVVAENFNREEIALARLRSISLQRPVAMRG